MATQEYLLRYIETNKTYGELPYRLKLAITEDDWARKVKAYCIHRGVSWAGSPASRVIPEHEYYEALLGFHRTHKRLFPYHLGEYICRVLRMTPFRYYRDILADAMRDDSAYDAIPNFAAADAVRVVGVGRNQYISIMQQAKSKKLLWRVNKGIVRDLLPADPRPPAPEPWWTVHLVNLGEVEYRSLSRAEVEACQIAAKDSGARCCDIEPRVLEELHRKGLVWLGVPITPQDHLSIPPLEGFVSNKTAVSGAEVDPLETLMYQVFVAASDRVTVAKLASILNVEVDTLEVAISVACRLKFCRKLQQSPSASHDYLQDAAGTTMHQHISPSSPATSGTYPLATLGGGGAAAADLEAVLGGAGIDGSLEINAQQQNTSRGHSLAAAEPLTRTSSIPAASLGKDESRSVALVVDSEVTGYLMMGALTPAVKKHSVTLFEGGRVYGSGVIDELVAELRASVEMAAGFEGEMASLAATAASLAVVLDCVRSSCRGSRPIELLRKESVANLTPSAAFRILAHSYSVVLPISGLPYPPLPLSLVRQGPTNYGPIPASTTPWMQLALYRAVGTAPVSLVLPAGRRVTRLPSQLEGCCAALVWPWNAHAVRAKPAEAVVVQAPAMLHSLNALLKKSAVLVQPLRGKYSYGDPVVSKESENAAAGQEGCAGEAKIVDVPLPLPAHLYLYKSLETTSAGGSGWADFDMDQSDFEPATATELDFKAPGMSVKVQAIGPDGISEEIQLPAGCAAALHSLGLACAVGSLHLLRDVGVDTWVALHVSLGVPLQPRELCQAVCDSAAAAQFLDSAACQRHSAGQRTLQDALQHLIAQHGAYITAGGRDDDLAADVALPVHPIEVDVRGRLLAAELPGVLQGVAFLEL